MPYLNVELNYEDHPKTRKLMKLVGQDADILPIRLWLYCGRIHPKDGRMRNYTAQDVADAVKFCGDAKKLVSNFGKAGFLRRIKNGFACVDWHQHQGHLEAFSRLGKAAAQARWCKHATSNAQASVKQCLTNAPTEPNRTVPTESTEPNRTVPSTAGKQPVDSRGESPTTGPTGHKAILQESAGAAEEQRLLETRWLIEGDYKGAHIGSLPIDYCLWAIEHLTRLGTEYQAALRLRIKMHQEDTQR